MDLSFSDAEEAFRAEVREFFATELTDELREAGRLMTSVYSSKAHALAWQKILFDRGWLVPSWPEEYGGCGWSLTQRYIFACERARARPPALSPMGLSMLGPALLGCGTKEQKDYYLPRILRGEDYWCQGYSEPQAGSDLASLQCRAERDGDAYVLNGTKIWTTHAQYATHMFCLVRTAQMDRPQRGITFLLLDMRSPGVTVDPIVFASGAATQATVFFENVRVPVANVVGEENDGWTVAKYLLEFERGGGAAAPGLIEAIGDARELLAPLPDQERADAGRRLDALEAGVRALEIAELQSLAETERTGSPGAGSSMLKLKGTELSQAITEIAVEAAGWHGAVHQPDATRAGSNVEPIGPAGAVTAVPFYLNNRAATIYAGSSEVQRNIIAKAVLGL
ncbi:MAG: acyl-CoA dehydrogenase family protein [Pseudomonadales bacterium]|jgi:acyl-CoA dehydrogenase|nr:acyl-CoA dehydrogenase family protein [Pseudomonadales bacterium]